MGTYKRLVFTDTFLEALKKLQDPDHRRVMDALEILDRDPESRALQAHEIASHPGEKSWEGRRFMAANTREDVSLKVLYVIEVNSSPRLVMLTCYRPGDASE